MPHFTRQKKYDSSFCNGLVCHVVDDISSVSARWQIDWCSAVWPLYEQALPREPTEDVIMHGRLLYYQGMRDEKSAKRIWKKSTTVII